MVQIVQTLLAPPAPTITVFPRMEWSRRFSRELLPAPGTPGWEAAIRQLLLIKRIPADSPERRRERRTGNGAKAKPLKGKECAPAVAPYILSTGDRRCKADVLSSDRWPWVAHDVDAAPLKVSELCEAINRAVGHLSHVVWTTWSCRDGYASARILLPLSRVATTDEAYSLWWLTARLLHEAGIPLDSAKPGEPCLDSRAMDGRLFYLPSVPMPMVAGVEGWGGVVPIGFVSGDDVPPLDVDAVLPEARRVMAEDVPAHRATWPEVWAPGLSGKGRGSSATRTSSGSTSSSGSSGSSGSSSTRVPFSEVKFEGGSLREWADANLPSPNTETTVGSPWRDDGGSGEAGRSLRLHRDGNGRLWAHDFNTKITYFDGEPRPQNWKPLGWDEAGDLLPAVDRLAGIPVPLTPIVEEMDAERILDEVSDYSEVPSRPSEFSDTSALESAEDRLKTLGRITPGCKRGSSRVTASSSRIDAVYQPCGARTCPSCGPAIARAEAAAAGSLLSEMGDEGWTGLLVVGLTPSERKRVDRWRARSPETRSILVVPLAGEEGEEVAVLLSSDGFDHLNERKRDATPSIYGEVVESDALGDRVQALLLGRRGSLASGSNGLRGEVGLIRAISLIRDALLGRQRARAALQIERPERPLEPGTIVIRTRSPLREIRQAIADEVGSELLPAPGTLLDEGLGMRATWLSPHAGINLADVLESLVDRGIVPTLAPPVRGTPKAAEEFRPTSTATMDAILDDLLDGKPLRDADGRPDRTREIYAAAKAAADAEWSARIAAALASV